MLVEPVQTRNPGLQPADFMREIRAITEQTGSAMILDEVVTGFRLAPGGAQEFYGIRADMCTYGKVIGGGHPIGVLSGKHEYLDALDGGAWQFGDSVWPGGWRHFLRRNLCAASPGAGRGEGCIDAS